MNNIPKQISSHALAAKQIRKELKGKFPNTKFSVRSDSFSGGDSVNISWENGPTYDDVQSTVSKYQYGNFNGMEDIYEYTNNRNDIAQVKFVQCHRNFSDEIMNKYFEEFKKTLEGWKDLKDIQESSIDLLNKWGIWTAGNYIYQYLQDKTI